MNSRGLPSPRLNATVCFTVPQTVAVAEAVERGLQRREKSGHDVADMTPVCTLMVGRLDDWMKVVAKRDGIVLTPGYMDWAGVACIKRALTIFEERGYLVLAISAVTREGLPELVNQIAGALDRMRQGGPLDSGPSRE